MHYRVSSPWLDYGMFTPIQVAATVALDEHGEIPTEQIIPLYQKRRDVLIKSFGNAGVEALYSKS